MLDNFFRINMPYGLERNDNGEWTAFNREYVPLGFNDHCEKNKYVGNNPEIQLPIYTRYKNITEDILVKIAETDNSSIVRNNKGEIVKIWLYNDKTNPTNYQKDNEEIWKKYFDKIKTLSRIKTHNSY